MVEDVEKARESPVVVVDDPLAHILREMNRERAVRAEQTRELNRQAGAARAVEFRERRGRERE